MQEIIRDRIRHHSKGLYVAIIFPIAFASLLTFIGARIVSMTVPHIGLFVGDGMRIHHYAYGFFILAAAGYLALVFSGPRAKFLIALLFGFGLGLSFDEFAMWLKLREDDVARWEYDGMVIVLSFIFLILTVQPGVNFVFNHWPFSRKKLKQEHAMLESAGNRARLKGIKSRK